MFLTGSKIVKGLFGKISCPAVEVGHLFISSVQPDFYRPVELRCESCSMAASEQNLCNRDIKKRFRIFTVNFACGVTTSNTEIKTFKVF